MVPLRGNNMFLYNWMKKKNIPISEYGSVNQTVELINVLLLTLYVTAGSVTIVWVKSDPACSPL